MNNYCRNCGCKLTQELKKCPTCDAEIFEKRVVPELKKAELEAYKKKEKKYINTSITLFSSLILLPILINTISSLFQINAYNMVLFISPLLLLAFIISLIYARVMMPSSKPIRTMFNVVVICGLVYAVFILIIIMSCFGLMGNSLW